MNFAAVVVVPPLHKLVLQQVGPLVMLPRSANKGRFATLAAASHRLLDAHPKTGKLRFPLIKAVSKQRSSVPKHCVVVEWHIEVPKRQEKHCRLFADGMVGKGRVSLLQLSVMLQHLADTSIVEPFTVAEYVSLTGAEHKAAGAHPLKVSRDVVKLEADRTRMEAVIH